MRAYVVERWLKGPEELVIRNDAPEPSVVNLKEGEVIVDVKAIGLNFFDILMIQGKYQIRPPFPFIPGGELSGVITAAHPSVKNYKVGDRVFGSNSSYAERTVINTKTILPMPANFSFEEAAGLYITYPTSYAALVLKGQLKQGEVCLIHAAAGGVGIAALQIAKALGATVIATAGSTEKLEICQKNGADFCINYRDKDWTQQVKNLTNGHGADVVYDPVGLIEESMKCTAWNGRILVVGFAKGTFEKVAMNRVLLKNISLVGVHWGAYTPNEPERIPEVWAELFRLFAEGKARPVLYKHIYDLEEIPAGLEAIGGRKTYGKVVARIGGGKSKL